MTNLPKKTRNEEIDDFFNSVDNRQDTEAPNIGCGNPNTHNTLAEPVTIHGAEGTDEDLKSLTGEES